MNREELFKTAALANLDLKDDEVDTLAAAITQMLDYFSRMMAVDVESLEPTTHALLKTNRLRQDNEAVSTPDVLLACAPETEDRYIVIPNVL
ncbi:MAG: Asp-tRNA(Asn)/Glu-tRNA(Gln) amidotransferase subunit GatC [Spirochaetota bacterium]